MNTIAADFDGTLCEDKFPSIGEPKYKIIGFVKWLKSHGGKIILWTCREDIPEGDFLTQAVEWCRTYGLEFDYINENPEQCMGHPEKSRKIVADIYLDDKALNVRDIRG